MGKSNSLQSLLATKRSSTSPAYWLLLETSQSFALRHEATHDDDNNNSASDKAVYQRAGLRTPSENAARDWQAGPLWLQQCAVELLKDNSESGQRRRLLWLKTVPGNNSRRRWLQKIQSQYGAAKCSVLDCCGSDPFGWDDDNGDGESSMETGNCNLERLDLLLDQIKKLLRRQNNDDEPPVSLVIESLTPLLVRHGLDRTLRFLQRLSHDLQPSFLVIPVLVETLELFQLRRLEDASHAILLLDRGEAELLRQGVREKGNRVRERIPFRIQEDGSAIELLAKNHDDASNKEQSETNEEVDTAANALESLSVSAPESNAKRKVQLQADEGSRKPTASSLEATTTTASQPRIFLQDDDPEFEDYDEDDDLDL